MQPQAALADGDPASDYFPTVDIFVPLDRPAATNLQKDLDNLVFAAKRRGYVVKVAVIGSRTDLGAVSQLFGKPGTYAKFLGAEIRTFYTGRLLIVMPQGIGGRNVPAGELRALRAVKISAGSSDELVRTGMAAVRAGAAAAGVKLPVIPPTPAGVTTVPPAPDGALRPGRDCRPVVVIVVLVERNRDPRGCGRGVPGPDRRRRGVRAHQAGRRSRRPG